MSNSEPQPVWCVLEDLEDTTREMSSDEQQQREGQADGASGLPANVNYLGATLPPEYDGAPDALADDFEVVFLCGFRIDWSNDPIETLGRYASDYGGYGPYLLLEYYGSYYPWTPYATWTDTTSTYGTFEYYNGYEDQVLSNGAVVTSLWYGEAVLYY